MTAAELRSLYLDLSMELSFLQLNVWRTLEKDPLFQRPAITPTTDEQKRITALQFHQYCKYNFLPPDAQNLPYKRKVIESIILKLNF